MLKLKLDSDQKKEDEDKEGDNNKYAGLAKLLICAPPRNFCESRTGGRLTRSHCP